MKNVGIFWCFLLVWPATTAGTIEVKCPEFCTCDVFHGLRRATCRDRKLVSIELNLPVQAEMLDISRNQIRELGDKIFLELGLTNLKLLNISHNMVRQIHFNGFRGMETLKTLDLSFNAIEYFTRSWFESLQSLEELYLKGNKLRSINEEARIDINSLKILDISKCGITRLNANTFRLVPNLETLDVSENFIQSLEVDVLKCLPKLRSLQLHENNFDCQGQKVHFLEAYVKIQKIAFTDSCESDVKTTLSNNHIVQRFEKMRMANDLTTPTNTDRNSWIIEDSADDNVVKRIEECRNATDNLPDVKPPGLLMEIIQLSPWVTVTVIFSYGVLCGMVLTCLISLCTNPEKKRLADLDVPDGSVPSSMRITQSVPDLFQKRVKRNVRRSNSMLYRSLQRARLTPSRSLEDDDDGDETLIMNEFDLANSTPVVTRKVIT